MDQIGAAQSAAPPPVPTELGNYAARFVGPDPLDCGQHLITTPFVTAGEEELQRSVACASDAAEDRKAFWTIKQHQGIDSLIFHGLLGSQDGKVYRFLYDSAPCGGPGCAGRFSVERCDKPVAVKRGNVAEFACKP